MEEARRIPAADLARGLGEAPKSLRLLYGLVAADVRAGRIPDRGFEARHYRALLWRSLFS
jgi:hypothetical protein